MKTHPDVLELAQMLEPTWPAITARLAASGAPTALERDPMMMRVKQLNTQISAMREETSELWLDFEQARDQLAADQTASSNPKSALFKAAERANAAYEEKCAELRTLEEARDGVLSMVEGGNAGGNGPQDGDADADRTALGPVSAGALSSTEQRTVDALVATPGAWLATVLEDRKRDVATLPNDLRVKPRAWAPSGHPMAAAPAALTTTQVSTIVQTEAMIDLLAPQSVAIASGITVLRIDTTKTRVPRFTDLPVAEWIAERGAFPKSAPGLEMVDVEPPKVGLVSPLSVEVFEDLTPLGLSLVQVQMLRAVALAYDAGILFGDGTGESPLGVANSPGIVEVTAPLAGLRPFSASIAALIGNNAFPGALVMNPLDLGLLFDQTESSGATESNVPLWKTAIRRAADGAFALDLPYFGVPIWPTPAAPRGESLLYDPRSIIAVLRRPADLALDPYYDFDHGEVGLRTYLRGDVVVGQGEAAVHIILGQPATAAASSDVVTASSHGLSDGDAIAFKDVTGGAGLVEGTTYYVRDSDANTFKVAATPGGAAIDITSNMTAGTLRRD